ncbi:MAG: acetate kinase, partial [Lachnospiraceae bacterium]|nr:acetate kinase [Lachnospiraceae bacterium]
GTRSGDLDPAIIEYLMEKENKTAKDIVEILNKRSGMVGLQKGGSSDFRDVLADYQQNKPEAVRTLDAYIYRIAKYIGAYTAAMNGVDVICFTAGIGENSGFVREAVCKYLGFMGVKLDAGANALRGDDTIISTPDSPVTVMSIPTNEELMIARDTKAVVENKG